MREREQHAQDRRDTRKYFYELACEIVDEVLSLPMIQSNLEFSLRFIKLTPEEQAREFEELVELNASRCVYGEPEMGITPEIQCNYLIGIVDLVAHARPALEHAITLHRETGKPLPKQLREWEPGSARPKRRGPRPQVQDATALRERWLPDGKRVGLEWSARNPQRVKWRLGSFKSWRKSVTRPATLHDHSAGCCVVTAALISLQYCCPSWQRHRVRG